LREKHGVSVFGNGMRRKIFGPKRGQATEDWMKVHVEKFHDLCFSPNIILMII
jgi:hypothetical protein